MSQPANAGRLAVLTAAGGSLIFFGFAFFAHNALHDKDLQRTRSLEARLAARGIVAPGASSGTGSTGPDAVEATLALQPDARVPEARVFFDDGELDAFVAAKVRGPFEAPSRSRSLVPPEQVGAVYGSGAVTLSWEPGALNSVLASTYARQGQDLRVAFHVYRGVGAAPPSLAASVPWGQSSWRDHQLPLGRERLVYEVWAVILQASPRGDVLIAAERSEPVTVLTPEHFTLELLGGDAEEAVFVVDLRLPSAPGRVTSRARIGEELRAGELSTGLVVQAITLTPEERLSTQRRLLFTTDGSLILDPETRQPRTTQTQVLVPARHLSVVLATSDGQSRELGTDLP
jgi:hypothetical protein